MTHYMPRRRAERAVQMYQGVKEVKTRNELDNLFNITKPYLVSSYVEETKDGYWVCMNLVEKPERFGMKNEY